MDRYAKRPLIALLSLAIMGVLYHYFGYWGWGALLGGFALISFGYRIGTGRWL